MLMPLRGTLGPLGAAIRVAVPFPMAGLVSFWKMDEASGTAIDIQGTNNFTANGSIGTAAGIISTARVFAGAETFTCAHNATQDFTTRMTHSMWLYPNGGTLQYLLAQSDNLVAVPWFFRYGSDFNKNIGMFFDVGASSGQSQTADLLPANQWVHIVFVYDGTLTGNANRLKCYKNGNLLTLTYAGTIPSTITPANLPLSFGSLMNGGVPSSQFYGGRIDLMGLWNVALSASQVAALYNSGAGLQP